MKKSKNQIKYIGWISISCLILALALEFHILFKIEPYILKYLPFLKFHRNFFVNILIGFACSGGVVIAGEYIEYKRIDYKLKYEIDLRLRNLYRILNEVIEKECLADIKEFRDKKLSAYKKPFIFVDEYSPFESDEEKEEYYEKINILDYEVYSLFYITLDVLIQADLKQKEEYCNILYRSVDETERAFALFEVKSKEKSMKQREKYHLTSFKNDVEKLRKKIYDSGVVKGEFNS